MKINPYTFFPIIFVVFTYIILLRRVRMKAHREGFFKLLPMFLGGLEKLQEIPVFPFVEQSFYKERERLAKESLRLINLKREDNINWIFVLNNLKRLATEISDICAYTHLKIEELEERIKEKNKKLDIPIT